MLRIPVSQGGVKPPLGTPVRPLTGAKPGGLSKMLIASLPPQKKGYSEKKLGQDNSGSSRFFSE